MDERDWLVERFEENRTHLKAVAYRMLGSLNEADDAVQEAWIRLGRSDADEIQDLRAWLTTVVARVSLNMLRSRKRRREESMDLRMPDPIIDPADGTDPEHEALLADSVGLALLVVLETLTPAERLSFRSDGALGVARWLRAPWSWLVVLRVVPRPLRDWIYERVARARYRIFGKLDACPLPSPAHRARFLD